MVKVNGRRMNGEGTFFYRKDRKLWRCEGYIAQPDGTSKRITFYDKNKGEAKRKFLEAKKKAQLLIAQIEDGIYINEKETVTQALTRWADNIEEQRNKSITTTDAYRTNIKRITPFLGHIKLIELKAKHISEMYRSLRNECRPTTNRPFSSSAMLQVHNTLYKYLKDMVTEGTLVNNPMERVTNRPTRGHNPEINPLTKEEAKKFLSLTRCPTRSGKEFIEQSGCPWMPLFAVLIHTGLRLGEAVGLSWDNVDLEGGRLRNKAGNPVNYPALKVTASLKETIGKGFVFGPPKTPQSKRIVPLNPYAVLALREHRVRQAEQRLSIGPIWNTDRNLVFSNSTGEPVFKSVVRGHFKNLIKSAGIDRNVRLHDLRHTCGSLMYQNGVDIKSIQTILGHRNIQTTYDLYVKTNDEMIESGTDALYEALTTG